MAAEDVEALANEMLRVGERALRFQQYILRRAYGLFYAVWALAYVFFGYLPALINMAPPIIADSYATYFACYTAVGGLAGYATSIVFMNAGRAIRLKSVLEAPYPRGAKGPRRKLAAPTSFAIAATIALGTLFVYHFFGLRGFALYFLVLLYWAFHIARGLRRSFGNIPFEGWLATASFAAACAVSAYAEFAAQYFILDLVWPPTIFVWAFSALYALYRAPECLVNQD